MSRTDIALYALLLFCFMLNCTFALYDQRSSDVVFAVRRSIVDVKWRVSTSPEGTTATFRDVHSVADVWDFLQGPVQSSLFQDTWYNGDSFTGDVDSQLGMVDRGNMLLGGVELRLLRVGPTASCNGALPDQNESKWCYPPYSTAAEYKTVVSQLPYFEDTWSDAPTSNDYEVYRGMLAVYAGGGYRRFLPRLGINVSTSVATHLCDSRCELTKLRRGRWLDESSRALFVRFNLYNAAFDLHCVVQLLFEFGVAASRTAEGGGGEVIASAQVTPLHLIQYPGLFVVSPRFLTELGMLVGVAWFAHKQVDKLLQYRLFYFLIPNHVADFSIVVLWASIAVLRVQSVRETAFPMLLTLAESSDRGYVDLGASVHYLRTERSITAACAVLMWWRLLRLAKTVKPLESTVDKLERAQILLQGYALLLLVYVLGFAHAGVLLFPSARSSFRNYAVGMALARRWHPLDIAAQVDMQLFRLLFQFSTTFVVLNIVVAILRERFDSSRVKAKAAAIDGLAMLELAKQQLEAHGMRVEETSFAKKLRVTAARGIKKLQLATRGMLAVPDEDEKLSDLKKAWGLDQPHLQLEYVPEDEAATDPPSDGSSLQLLAFAEEYEQKLDGQMSVFSSRLNDMLSRLGTFQSYLGDELGPDEIVHEVIDAERIPQTETTSELPSISQNDVVDSSSVDSTHESSDASAALPGAINSTEESAEF
ncbi:TRP-like ion channel Pkd2 [Phytophthora boehmeriae]|uniref:TRP-like ion channel Pkd2 n=1 Tax=Phytophthora boehmeriae TaxID=109152 RepID=A0A8T1WQ59_9STRA|nr:TRP-like ion channel Pkd2 [Phytophthora boehmeriae]